jgi:hypothetical protein
MQLSLSPSFSLSLTGERGAHTPTDVSSLVREREREREKEREKKEEREKGREREK